MSREQEAEFAVLKKRLKNALAHADLMGRTFCAMAERELGNKDHKEFGERGYFTLDLCRTGDACYPVFGQEQPNLITIHITLRDDVDETKFAEGLTSILNAIDLTDKG